MSVISHVSSFYEDFQPTRVLLLEELARELYIGEARQGPPGRRDYLAHLYGPESVVCERYGYTSWEMLTSEDEDKCQHLLSTLMIFHYFYEMTKDRVR